MNATRDRASSERLDLALSRRPAVGSRERARALILAGRVRVAGQTERRPGRLIHARADVELVEAPRFVSRGGEKLDGALDRFGVVATGRICADIGASTGGFTDVLLQRGAGRVYAVDVGRGLINWRLRQDPRVVMMERVNARHLEAFAEPVSLLTVDVSFIGLEKVLPALLRAAPQGELVALFKPQIQVPRGAVASGGVVRDLQAVAASLAQFRAWVSANGYRVLGEAASTPRGADGNQEWFLHLEPARP